MAQMVPVLYLLTTPLITLTPWAWRARIFMVLENMYMTLIKCVSNCINIVNDLDGQEHFIVYICDFISYL